MPDTPRLLTALDRVNAAHPWSHNDAYARFVMRHARAMRRRGGTIAVDVGCGTGQLLARLQRVMPIVIGIEVDEEAARVASERFEDTSVRIQHRPFGDEPVEAYDLIVFVASLHHMPLRQALRQARAALRPGGRLVIVGVAREQPGDAVRSLVSVLLNPIIGLLRHPRRGSGLPEHMWAPTALAEHSFAEIRAIASQELPGIRMRPRLFWRYTASWIAPHRAQG